MSFTRPESRRTTRPSASTASSPATRARIVPCRSTCAPPASVAVIPPIVAESRAAKSTPSASPLPRSAAGQRGRGHARADRDLRRRRVELADRVEPGEREHDLARARDLAADEPGVAALRHERRARLRARGDHRRHLRGGARPHDPGSGTAEAPGDVALVARGQLGIGEHVALADQLGQPRAERGLH